MCATKMSSSVALPNREVEHFKRVQHHDDMGAHARKRLRLTMDPTDFVNTVFEGRNYDTNKIIAKATNEFIKPTAEMITGYATTSELVREDNLDKLKELHASGVSMQCCNRFGDSLVHIACRRGLTRIVKFLVEEAKASVHVRDDLLRTPLHDALWTSEPNFEIVEILLRAAPEHVLLPDRRGDTPLDYTRPEHAREWVAFLARQHALLRPSTSIKKY